MAVEKPPSEPIRLSARSSLPNGSVRVLGLTLVAALAPADLFLRQGCLLVSDPKREIERKLVYRDGRSEPFSAATDVEAFAKAAAEAFGVGESRVVDFDAKAANVALAALSDKKAAKKTKKGVKP